jgi:hypothetical protein
VKPASDITDRAKRYRANRKPPPGPRRCNFCASRRNIDIDHITGTEEDEAPENLMYLCRTCNTLKGITQARNRIGVRTRQYNPEEAMQGRTTFDRFKHAAGILLGKIKGSAAAATEYLRRTRPDQRVRFGDRIEAANPFRSEAQRRKFYAMLGRGEISAATLKKFARGNPAAPTYAQYAHGVSVHQRGAHDEGGAIIHATPAALRRKYAAQIARTKAQRRGSEIPF